MALTNSQYDTIMRGYDRRQYENYRRQCARTDEIYEKFPRIREIQEAAKRPITFDEDCEELSPAMLKAFRCVAAQRNRNRKTASESEV